MKSANTYLNTELPKEITIFSGGIPKIINWEKQTLGKFIENSSFTQPNFYSLGSTEQVKSQKPIQKLIARADKEEEFDKEDDARLQATSVWV